MHVKCNMLHSLPLIDVPNLSYLSIELHNVVHLDDIGMPQAFQHLQFPGQKPVQEVLRCLPLVYDLQRYLFPQTFRICGLNLGVRPFAQGRSYRVSAFLKFLFIVNRTYFVCSANCKCHRMHTHKGAFMTMAVCRCLLSCCSTVQTHGSLP